MNAHLMLHLRVWCAGVFVLMAMFVAGWTFQLLGEDTRAWTLSQETPVATCACSAQYVYTVDACGRAGLMPIVAATLAALAAHAIMRSPPALLQNACFMLRAGLWAATCVAYAQAIMAWLPLSSVVRVVHACEAVQLQRACIHGASMHASSPARLALGIAW